MAAVTAVRFLGDVLGLGEAKVFAAQFTDSEVPTSAIGPTYIIPLITTAIAVERGGISDLQTRGVCLRAAVGSFYVSANSSANVTTSCFISTGTFAYFPYKSGVSTFPWVQATSSTAAYEVWAFGVATV